MKQNMCVLILILVFTSISLLSAQSISLEGVLSRLSEGTYGEVAGNYLFVLSDHITIYDISDWLHAKEVGAVEISGRKINAFAIKDSFLLVIGTDDRFRVFALGDTVHPSEVANLRLEPYTGRLTHQILIIGDYAYLPARTRGLKILNIANPRSPSVAGSYSCTPNALRVKDTILFAITDDGLTLLNISNPTSPVWLTDVRISGTKSDIMFADSLFYLLSWDTIKVFAFHSPTSVAETAYYAVGTGTKYMEHYNDSIALLLCDTMLATFNLNYLDTFMIISSLGGMKGIGQYLINLGNKAIVITSKLLHFYDISDPTALSIDTAYGFYFEDSWRYMGYLFSLDKFGHLGVIDIGRPSSMHIISVIPLYGSPQRLMVKNGRLYYRDFGSGVGIVDVSTPTMPYLAGAFRTGSPVYSFTIKDSLLYTVTIDTFYVVNPRNPFSPDIIHAIYFGGVSMPSNVLVDVPDYRAFILSSNSTRAKLYIYDLTSPLGPTLLDTVDIDCSGLGYVAEMKYIGHDRLLMTFSDRGIRIYDVMNPHSVSLVDEASFDYIRRIFVRDTILFANDGNRLLVIKISPDDTMQLLETFEIPYVSYLWGGIYVHPPYAFLSEGSYLFAVNVSEYAGVTEQAMLPEIAKIMVSPNPFNKACRISLSGITEPAVMKIISIDGRVVQRIAVSHSGTYYWRPADDVSSGVYEVVVESSGGVVAKKVAFIK